MHSEYYKPPVRFTLPVGSEPTEENIKAAVEELKNRRDRYQQLHDYYNGEHCILDRVLESDTAKNNKLVNNFASYIADICASYLLGNPVDYKAPEGLNINAIMDKYREQGLSDVDSDLALDAGIYGMAYDLTFTDETSEPKTVTLDPRNTIMVYDDSVQHRELFAIYCGDVKEETETITYLTVYTPSEIIDGSLNDGKFTETKRKPHFFNEVPVVEYQNNKNRTGNFEPVLSLIDAYNTLQSDRVNDHEQLADAILVLKNFTLDQKKQLQLRDNRMISSVPADGDAFYLTKPLSESDADILTKRIADDIHKFSKTPNLSDENFVGNSSGVALNYKLLAFEEETKTRERHMEKGLKKRLRLYFNLENHLKQGAGGKTAADIMHVDVIFNRNLPRNDYETSQMIVNLQGMVKDEILIKQLSFVDNAEEAIVEKEPDEYPEQFPTLTADEIETEMENRLGANNEQEETTESSKDEE